MMDEIKLKNGIMWNCKNNEVTGFVKDQLNTSKMMEEILGLETKTKNKGKQTAVYADQ